MMPAATLVSSDGNLVRNGGACSPRKRIRDRAVSASATSFRMISSTERMSLIPPAVWPAVNRHSCCRPACVVDTI